MNIQTLALALTLDPVVLSLESLDLGFVLRVWSLVLALSFRVLSFRVLELALSVWSLILALKVWSLVWSCP